MCSARVAAEAEAVLWSNTIIQQTIITTISTMNISMSDKTHVVSCLLHCSFYQRVDSCLRSTKSLLRIGKNKKEDKQEACNQSKKSLPSLSKCRIQ
jgi:hypothetical protein